MKIDLFIPCFIDSLYPQVGEASVRLLKRFGCELNYNIKQTCCGQPAFNTGYWNEAKKVAEFFYENFSGENFIVAPSGSCVSMVKVFYKELLDNDKYTNLSSRIYEISDFIHSILKKDFSELSFEGKVILHEACHSARELFIMDKVKFLLKSIKGLELSDFPYNEECCGFGGTFSSKFSKMSIDIGLDKLKNYSLANSKTVLSTDSSCLMHQKGISKNTEYVFEFLHLVEFIDRLYTKQENQVSFNVK